MTFDRAQAQWDNATPPDSDTPCRNCSHMSDDHEQDGTCLATVRVQRWRLREIGEYTPYWRTVPCDCEGYEPRTLDDELADEGDRLYSEIKERF